MFETTPVVQNWTTGEEIRYLNTIGTHGPTKNGEPKKPTVHEKIRLLQGALEAFAKRSRWGSIDRETVIAHAKKLLADLTN